MHLLDIIINVIVVVCLCQGFRENELTTVLLNICTQLVCYKERNPCHLRVISLVRFGVCSRDGYEGGGVGGDTRGLCPPSILYNLHFLFCSIKILFF